jgi:hypothetical protein
LPKKQPTDTPAITGQPNKAANGIRQSATRNWIGPKDIGAKTMTRTAYRLENTIAKLISFVFILYFYLPTPGFLMRNGWEVPPTRKWKRLHESLKNIYPKPTTIHDRVGILRSSLNQEKKIEVCGLFLLRQ